MLARNFKSVYWMVMLFFLALSANAELFAQQNERENKSTKEVLQALFESGKTFKEICSQADQHFSTKYPDLSRDDLCRGEHRDGTYVKYQRWVSFWKNHLNPDGTLGDITKRAGLKAAGGEVTCDEATLVDFEWTNSGYDSNMGYQIDQGRTNAMAFHPYDQDIFFVGAAWGGLWKTEDGGASYTVLNDNLPSASIASIVIDHQNPNNIAVALSDILWFGPSGIGVFVSHDGGLTFSPTDISWEFSEDVKLYHMDIDPNNPERVLVATSVGIYKTEDFFETSTLVLEEDFRFIVFSKSTENLAFAGGWSGQFYRSEDAGSTFEMTEDFGGERVRIAVAYAEGSEHIAVTNSTLLHTSTDNGLTFETYLMPESNMVVAIDPLDDNIINLGNFEAYRSDDFGESIYPISQWLGNDGLPFIHVDQRNVFVSPLLDDYIFYCNDGGISRYSNGEDSFDNLSKDLLITQYYDIGVSQTDEFVLGGGSQDNGNVYRDFDGSWGAYAVTGDGMVQEIDPNDATVRYYSYQNGSLVRWENGDTQPIAPPEEGGNGAWETPYKIDPSNPNRLVVGYKSVYTSDDRGDTWEMVGFPIQSNTTLDQIAIAPSNSEKMYASRGSTLLVKTPGVDLWAQLPMPNDQGITDLEVDPFDENIVYVSLPGYENGYKIFRSEDSGENWTNITANLPNLPFTALELHREEDGGIYVGTTGAVYHRDNTSPVWQKLGCLPNTTVTDIEIQYFTNKIFAATHGRGIFEGSLNPEATSIDELRIEERISIYPNPTSDILKVAGRNVDLSNSTIEVRNTIGKIFQVPVSRISNEEIELDCSGLISGNYFLTITDEQQEQHVLKFTLL